MANCCESLASRLQHRVTLQQVSQSSDGQGGFTESWSSVATLFAEIKPQKSYERFQAAQMQTPTTHKITIRYRAGITTKHRLIFGTRVFEIKGIINPDEANRILELTALELS